MEEIEKLKARAYDIILQIEMKSLEAQALQEQLREIQRLIQEKEKGNGSIQSSKGI